MNFNVNDILEVSPGYCGDNCAPLVDRENVITVLSDKTTVGVWEPGVPCKKKAMLTGHEKKVTAICVSPPDARFICSCSPDKVFLWDLVAVGGSCRQEGVLVGVELGYIVHCEFSWNRRWLALCRERQILIISLQFNESALADITTHGTVNTGSAQCSLTAFSPQYGDILVTVEDSYFKVWNVASMGLLHQSSSYGVHSLTFGVFDKTTPKLMLGTNNGMVHVYNTSDIDHALPWNIFSVDVGKTFANKIAENHQEEEQDEEEREERSHSEGENCSSDVSCIVLSAQLFQRESPPDDEGTLPEQASTFNDETYSMSTYKLAVAPGSVLAVCCNLGIVLFDSKSAECLTYCYFYDLLAGISLCLIDFVVLGGESLRSLRCVLKDSSVGQRLRVISLSVEDSPLEDNTGVSVISDVPVAPKCPLRSQMTCSQVSVYETANIDRGDQKSRRTKSSGYGYQPPRRQMFTPIINRPRTTAKPGSFAMRKPSTGGGGFLSKCDSDVTNNKSKPPSKLREKVRIWETLGTAINLAASGDGRQLACSSTLSDICVLKFEKLNVANSVNLFGHNAAVNSLHFSLDSKLLVSASNDSSVMVWDWSHKKCVLTIDKTTRRRRTQGKLQDDPVGPVSAARFYYMDQFVLLSIGGSLQLYCHLLHETSANNITQTSKQGYKRVHTVGVPAKHITCFTAVNQFHSYLVLCGCSNKSVQVYDMNAERFSVGVENVHARPPHCLRQMGGATPMYDLFLTSAVCDGVKMWDMRTVTCAQKYSRHVNRSYACGIDSSPCGRYLAVGSEDKAVYVYDTRRCEDYLGKLTGLGDVAMDVVFNPTHPLMAAAALNGYVMTYS